MRFFSWVPGKNRPLALLNKQAVVDALGNRCVFVASLGRSVRGGSQTLGVRTSAPVASAGTGDGALLNSWLPVSYEAYGSVGCLRRPRQNEFVRAAPACVAAPSGECCR